MDRVIPRDAKVVDGEGHVLGRLASVVAKRLLKGEKIIIVNADKIVLSGEKRRVIESYKLMFEVRTLKSPYRHSPHRPRSPENIVRRAIRGMLPIDKPKGRMAYKRLRVFVGVPPELKDKSGEFEKIPEALSSRLSREYITVREVAIEMGWKPR